MRLAQWNRAGRLRMSFPRSPGNDRGLDARRLDVELPPGVQNGDTSYRLKTSVVCGVRAEAVVRGIENSARDCDAQRKINGFARVGIRRERNDARGRLLL